MLQWILYFPLAFYAGYVRQHAYGLSNQTFWKWLHDLLVEGAVGLAFGGLLIWLPYWLIHRSPRRWWLYTAILSLPVMFFVMLVEPIWVAPLFNRFGPMHDKQLEAQILALADEAGIEGGRVFEVNKSVDTNAVNAYVTGLGSSKRIVLWDTLLAKLEPGEVRVVMAHEMGHYVLNHVLQGLLAGFCGVLVALYLVYRAANFLLRRYKDRFGFDRLSDVASLPLLLLLAQVVALAMMPVGLAFSRHLEHEADRFALELTRDNQAAATAFVRLQSENLSNPTPGKLYHAIPGEPSQPGASGSSLPTTIAPGNRASRFATAACSNASLIEPLRTVISTRRTIPAEVRPMRRPRRVSVSPRWRNI